ncbi:MAG TPA: large conductance mechanosensitive channel protein MscL [Ktedonobacterales bacterium]|nr:large conductance mechanosensitive channel protein MscL [Ktedonobacterales bacterium]
MSSVMGRDFVQWRVLLVKVFREFREFILRGNVVDLAVGVVIGAAFGNVVSAIVKDLITPLIGFFVGRVDFSSIKAGSFLIGDVINVLVSFIIIAVVVFFFVVLPVNTLIKRVHKEKAADPATRECPFCYNGIPLKATRCGFCTSEVEAIAAAAVVATDFKLPKE